MSTYRQNNRIYSVDGGSGNVVEFLTPANGRYGSKFWMGHPDPDVDIATININGGALAKKGVKVGFL